MMSSDKPQSDASEATFSLGDWRIEPASGTISRAGESVRLEPKVMAVLVALADAGGAVVSKEALLQAVWPDAVVEEAALSRCISELRRALGDDARQPRYIETIPKRGYRLAAAAAPPPGGSWRVLSPWALVTGLALLVVAVGVYRELMPDPGADSITSVAVLPVENLTGDAQQDFYAEGLTDGLITELGSIGAFERVTSRSSVLSLPARQLSMAEIGRRLGVGGIVEASVLTVSPLVRLNARLIDAATDRQVWSGSFAGDPGEIALLYGEVARAVAGSVRPLASPDRRPAPRLVNPAAHTAYLRGRHFWSRRTAAGYRQAEMYFREAIRLDPSYAIAYAGLADNFFMSEQPSRAVSTREARSYAARALELDDSIAEAHTTLAFMLVFDWQWDAAEEEFVTAIELNPSYVTARHWYGLLLSWRGRAEEADRQLVRARQLDPLSPLLVSAHAATANNRGAFERGVEIAREGLALDESFNGNRGVLATAYTQLGRHDEAIEIAAQAATDDEPLTRVTLAIAYAAAGRRADAQRILDEFEMTDPDTRREENLAYYSAAVYAAWGDYDRALEYLEAAYAEGSTELVAAAVDPRFIDLHDQPQFIDLLQRLGLR